MSTNHWNHKAFLAFSFGLAVQLMFQICANAEPAFNNKRPQNIQAQGIDSEIKVAVARQDAKGKTQHDLDANFLINLEAYTVDRVKTKAMDSLESQGIHNAKINLISSSVYIEYDTIKLAVIKISSADGANQVWITGILDNEIIRIVCVRNTTESIPISYGKCGEKIESVFGKRIGS